MKKWIFILSLSCSLTTLFAQSNIDVLHYKFEINLNDKNDTIYGQTEITVASSKEIHNVTFDLTNLSANGKGMKVDSIKSRNLKGHWNVLLSENPVFVRNDDVIKLDYSKKGYVEDTAYFNDVITIYYHGIPDDGLIISKNKFGDRTFFADNWPDRAHHWIPCVDNPADKASFEFIVTAPSQFQVISNGEKVEEKILDENRKLTHWKEDAPLSTKIMVIGVAKFAVKEFSDSPAGVPISAWVYPKDSTQGFKNYSVAPDIIKFYSSYIGPYPFNKLANVQSTTIYGGMENASAIFYNEISASSIFGAESLLAHEIAHQWFGDMVSEKKFAHLWLSEGFATYFAHLYTEKKYGRDSMENEMKDDREQVIDFSRRSQNPVVDSVSSFRRLLNPNSYQKGSWILHMLRRQMGDSVFHTIIKTFYEQYKGKNADTKDFEIMAEEVSGKKLDTFFHQWLYTAAIPHLHISWFYSEENKMIHVTVEQKQEGAPFNFPLEIAFKNKTGDTQIKKLNINRSKETFSFPATIKPLVLEADPNISLLFSGSIEELKN